MPGESGKINEGGSAEQEKYEKYLANERLHIGAGESPTFTDILMEVWKMMRDVVCKLLSR